ncbi:hypothetical protein [Salibacterium aidingense]|uniref:hypothetical protein n=1 Tax=Salibacterium aidingense TaxID=384933 RepID=UPI000478FB74|nr:hypothetical protein [Salibacterium aidingense]
MAVTKEVMKNTTLQILILNIALPIACGYFVNNFRITQLLGIPGYVYTSLLIILFFWTIYGVFSIYRNWVIKVRESKQYNPTSFKGGFYNAGNPQIYYEYGGFKWIIYIENRDIHVQFSHTTQYSIDIDHVIGPLCPKENCISDLNMVKTYFGKYKFTCPACSFNRTRSKNANTLARDMKKTLYGHVRREGLNQLDIRR